MDENSPILEAIFHKYSAQVDQTNIVKRKGKIVKVVGLVYESAGPSATMGEKCMIRSRDHQHFGLAEVVGFRDDRILLMPLEDIPGIGPGSEVQTTGEPFYVGVGSGLLGRVIDAFGNPIDGKGPITIEKRQMVTASPPPPMERRRITEPVATGIRAVDAFLTLGKGQKIGIFAGSGVGKSVLMGMIARNTSADINVIGLIGERGREVRDFLEKDLGEEGLKRSVVVVVTGDQAALLRIKASMVATAVAEYFREQGKDVLMLMDSVTRIAMAQRELGLSIGEPPTTRGYPPSVYAMLPKLLERVGTSKNGSITGIYTVLVEGDDMNEPVADTVRSITDGHIVLDRRMAAANHYPAVSVLDSVSRLMIDVVSKEHRQSANALLDVLATYRESEDLINIGAYVRNSNPRIDRALEIIQPLNAFLRQDIYEKTDYGETVERLLKLGVRAGVKQKQDAGTANN